MKFIFLNSIITGILLAGMSIANSAYAGLIDVDTNITGVSSDWNLEFSLTNNLGGSNNLYFFGVRIDEANYVSGPLRAGTWDNSLHSGIANDIYNINWVGFSIATGSSLGGFNVNVTSIERPNVEVEWFAYARRGVYDGPVHYNTDTNPGFDSRIIPYAQSVPEPSTLAIFALGMIGLASRRFKKQS